MSTTIVPVKAFKDNYIWIVHESNHAFLVDPGQDEPAQAYLAVHQLQLDAIIITHHHWDHVSGIAPLAQGVPVYGMPRVEEVNHPVGEGQTISLLHRPCEVWSVPGHTVDHLAYVWHNTDTSVLFCGDTLFSAGCGRLFEGDAAQMYHSLQRFAQLPDDTLVCAAHEYTISNLQWALQVEPHNEMIQSYLQRAIALRDHDQPTLPSTIGLEKQVNPFLRLQEPSVVEAILHHNTQCTRDVVALFAALREWKNNA